MATTGRYLTPKTNLICDFDGTLTTYSTLNVLASIAYAHNPPATKPWNEIQSAYGRDLQAHYDGYRKPRSNLAEELDYQNSLRPVERASIERIEAAGMFRNVTAADLARGAAKAVEEGGIRFRAGFDRLVRKVVLGTGGRCEIVSVNWSQEFIRAAVNTAFPGAAGSDVGFAVAANDVDAEGSGLISRPFDHADGGIWTSEDKVRLVQAARDSYGHGHGSGLVRTVYVGDSPTDLGSLVEDDVVGIVIRDEDDMTVLKGEQRNMKEMLDKYETVDVRHVSQWNADEWIRSTNADAPRLLYWARDFGEICNSPLFVGVKE